MKRLLLGSLILPILGTSAISHAGLFDDIFGGGNDAPIRYRPRQLPGGDRDRRNPLDPRRPTAPATKPSQSAGGSDELSAGPNSDFEVKAAPSSLASAADFYKALGVASVWVDVNGQLTPQATQLRAILTDAEEAGLNSIDYWSAQLEQMFQSRNPALAAQLEMSLTQAYIRYATHLAIGRVNPQAVGEEIKVKAKTLGAIELAAVLKNTSTDLRGALNLLAPQWKAYQNLQATLAVLRQLDPAVEYPEVIVPKKIPRVGESSPALVAVKTRLQTLGYPVTETGPVFTADLRKVVNSYMSDNNISGEPDLNKGFWASITVPLSARIGQITLTMEKLRWLKNKPEDNHVEVNTAFQRLRVYEGQSLVLGMKTINGRPARMTPMLQDQIVNVELNPTWTVPARLVIQDKLPLINQDPYYLQDHHFIVLDSSMQREIDPYEIDWSNVSSSNVNSFYLQQQPGLGNALGVMKFNLTNPYAIYLHDTNERELFPKFYRQLSSGCVRLENPVALASYLLKDDPVWGSSEALASGMATTQWAVDTWPSVKNENYIIMKKAMPVYLMNLTVEVDEGGITKFGGDYYGQDNRLYQILKATLGH